MNVLILGSGGREHAFAWKIKQSNKLSNLFIAPGNAGTLTLGTNINIATTDFEAVKKVVLENNIKLVIVGPEDPLVKGIHDYFLNDSVLKNIPVIGPEAKGAQLEGSKDFSKEFMFRHNIPTARYKTITANNLQEGIDFLKELQAPYVLKADGLAAGKGVLICNDLAEATVELQQMITHKKFGNASVKVVIEEFLKGIELSVFVLTDGISYKILPSAKDYKRIGDGDTGLNTGGMGAVSPVPFADNSFLQKVEQQIVIPTIEGLKKDNIPYKGFIFIGLMNVNGNPYVIEYNCRMGDPETEVVLPRIKSDLLELLIATGNQTLQQQQFEVDEQTAVTVVLVSKGYPEEYEKGKKITGLSNVENSIVFHAGTKQDNENVLSNGGRVLAITSMANSIENARQKSYTAIDKICYENIFYRTDIGKDLM